MVKPGIYIGNLSNEGNKGAIIRSAEAFGINLVFWVPKSFSLGSLKGAEGADKHMHFIPIEDEEELVKYCRTNHFSIIAVENNTDCVTFDLNEVHYPVNPVFVFGNENQGVSIYLLQNAAVIVRIPQAPSYVRCLNVAIAASIVMNDFYQKNQVENAR